MSTLGVSTLPRPAGAMAGRFIELDGWRGICALLVALHHFAVAGPLFASTTVQNANLFVDFFFVLSGFVITHAYGDRIVTVSDAINFFVRRVGRVWPLHAVILLVLIGLEALRAGMGGSGSARAAFTGVDSCQAILPNAALLQAFLPPDGLSWNVPSWSISVEMGAYVAFAAGLFAFKARLPWFAAVLAAGSLVLLAKAPIAYVDATQGYGICRGLAGFFVGHLTYRLRRLTKFVPAPLTWLEVAAVAGALAFVCMAGRHWLSLLTPIVFAAVVWVFSFQGGALSRLLTRSAPEFLGRISYSIYMVHYPIVLLTGAACEGLLRRFGWRLVGPGNDGTEKMLDFGTAWADLLATAAYLAITLALATVTYRYIELPGQRMFKPARRADT